MQNNFLYGFWIWSEKLDAILSMFSALIQCDITEEDRFIIKHKLTQTNDEKHLWKKYLLVGNDCELQLELAYDAEDKDIIHLKLTTDSKLKEKIEALDLFQSIFRELKE